MVALIEVGGCEGESSTGDDDGPAKGGTGTGGASGASTGGFSGDAGIGPGGTLGKGGNPAGGIGGTSGIGGDLGGGPVTGGSGGDAGQGPQGGDSGDAGQGPGGDGGSGGAPDTTTVHGRVIDFWRVPLPGVTVSIGTQTVATNANGEFTIADVAPQYDLQLVVRWTTGRTEVYGWRYEGLTRRDPTLQVYKGRGSRSASYIFTPENATLGSGATLSFAMAGRDGSYIIDDVGGSGVQSSMDWVGPASMQVTAHALLWDMNSSDFPTGYRSYDTTALTLTESVQAMISLNLANETVASGTVSGAVTRNMTDDDANMMFVRFAGGARIPLVSDTSGTNSYSYLAPTLPNASITVAASTGYWSFGEYAVAHRDGISAPRANVDISVPLPPTQVSPQTAVTGVTTSTIFSWQAGTSHAYVLGLEDLDFYDGGFVVTSRTQTPLPSFADQGFSLRPNQRHNWRVETHGNASSVDALCGPNGFIDSMGFYIDDVMGPGTGDGSYTISTGRTFTTAP